MGLFILNEDKAILDNIALDLTNSLTEESKNVYMKSQVQKQKIIEMLNAGIKANGDMSKLTKINGLIMHVDDLTWLEKKQLQIEDKIKEYSKKLKSEESGMFSKVWTKVKQFLLKIVGFIVKAINKLYKNMKLSYKASKHLHDNDATSLIDLGSKADEIKDRNIKRKIASRSAALVRSQDKTEDSRFWGQYTKRNLSR